MRSITACLITVMIAFTLYFCSPNNRIEAPVKKAGGIEISSFSPDMIINNFEFQEVSLEGVDVEFNALRAYYYKSLDILNFEEVKGVLNKDITPYYFRFPEAIYDRDMKSLISTGKILITAADVFKLTGFGGSFDFERKQASLERNVVLQSGSLYVEGEQGIFDINDESFRLMRVEATVLNLGKFQEELKEVTK